MNMAQLIIKSADWKTTNKEILVCFVKGFYYIDTNWMDIRFVPPGRVALLHHNFKGFPLDPKSPPAAETICLAEIGNETVERFFRVEDRGISWSIHKEDLQDRLKMLKTINA